MRYVGVAAASGGATAANSARREPMHETLSQWSLTELRGRLRGGEVSATDAVRACLERIAADNAALRAFIYVDEDGALRAAQEADGRRARVAGFGAAALRGIPLAIKDMIDVQAMPTTAASRVLAASAPAEEDAECVRRLREAGAIMLGKTNLHEFAFGGSGVVSAFGAVPNPLDRTRVSGGSSSGSAVAVATGMCFGALGTDTAGSVRLPAACCGVVGFKPTWSQVPVAGVIPLAWSYDHVGTLARTVEDAGELYAVLAGEAPGWRPCRILRCGVPRQYFCEGLQPEVAAGFERALNAVRTLGWTLREVELEVTEDRRVSNAETWAFHRNWHGADARALAQRRARRGCGVDADLAGAAAHVARDGRAGGAHRGAEDAAQHKAFQCAGLAVGHGALRGVGRTGDGRRAGQRRMGAGLAGALGRPRTGAGDANEGRSLSSRCIHANV